MWFQESGGVLCCWGMWTQSSSLGSEVVQDGGVEGYALIFFCKDSKITASCWTTINRRMWDPLKKRHPMSKGKGEAPEDGRRGEVAFRIKPHTCQRCSEGSNKTLCTSGDPTETEPDLSLSVWTSFVEVQVSSGLPQGQGLWVQQTWVWHKPSWRRSPLTPPQSPQNLHTTGETDFWRHKQNPVCTRTQKKGAVTPPRDWPRLGCECPGVPGGAVSWQWPLQGRRHGVRQCAHGTFWRRSPFSSLPPPEFGLRSNNREGTQPHPSTENCIKDLPSVALPIRTRPSFPRSQPLPSETSITLLSLSFGR